MKPFLITLFFDSEYFYLMLIMKTHLFRYYAYSIQMSKIINRVDKKWPVVRGTVAVGIQRKLISSLNRNWCFWIDQITIISKENSTRIHKNSHNRAKLQQQKKLCRNGSTSFIYQIDSFKTSLFIVLKRSFFCIAYTYYLKFCTDSNNRIQGHFLQIPIRVRALKASGVGWILLQLLLDFGT